MKFIELNNTLYNYNQINAVNIEELSVERSSIKYLINVYFENEYGEQDLFTESYYHDYDYLPDNIDTNKRIAELNKLMVKELNKNESTDIEDMLHSACINLELLSDRTESVFFPLSFNPRLTANFA